MKEQSKLYFWDAAGKFEKVKETAHQKCIDKFDLTIYSLTPKGEKEPTRLILKLTPIKKPDCYLSKHKGVVMVSLDYQTFPASDLEYTCHTAASRLNLDLIFGNRYARFMQNDRPYHEKRISAADFFEMDPCEDEPGAQIYLRDKAFFLSVPPDMEIPDHVPPPDAKPLDRVPPPDPPAPLKTGFSELASLKESQKAAVLSIDMSGANTGGRAYLNHLFEGCQSLRELDLSAFDTTGVMEMGKMFFGCRNLRRLDLSSFDFSKVHHVELMFGECFGLEEVILSDTILQARCMKTLQPFEGYTSDELSDIWRSEYIAAGPRQADMAVERASAIRTRWVSIPFCDASEAEVRKQLGLNQTVKLTIVPHRPLKK